jgi:DNA-binding transcriptional LysR family regulator
LDFFRLSVFLSVAHRLSFSRAAEDLCISQPAVSKHVQQLENELGVQLFERLGRRAALTDAGRILVDYAQRVTMLTEEVRRLLKETEGLQRGWLRVGATATLGLYLLPDLVARFQSKYSGIETTLAIDNSTTVARRVLNAEVDVGFVDAPLSMPGLQVRPFARDEITLIVPCGHWLASHPASWAQMLPKATLITREKESGTRQIVDAGLSRLGVKPKRLMEIPGCEGVKRAVAAGLGIAFLSRRATTLEVAQGIICQPEIPELCFHRGLYMVMRKEGRPSAGVLAFLSLVTK